MKFRRYHFRKWLQNRYQLKRLLRANHLPCDEEVDNGSVDGIDEVEVDVPQHQSVGTVLSWQTDGLETTESYGREDVELLLQLAEAYRRGEPCDGVVLKKLGLGH